MVLGGGDHGRGFGHDRRPKGRPGQSPRRHCRRIGYVPDDRKASALLLVRSVLENFSISWLDRLSTGGILNTRRERVQVQMP